jgi:hypothetical protein
MAVKYDKVLGALRESDSPSGTVSGTNTGDETAVRIAAINHSAAEKTALLDADEITGQNSATSFSLIRTTWANVKAFLKSYFDTLYSPIISKTYHVFLTQVTTGAPSASVLEDTVTSVVLARSSTGTYTATKTGAFTSGKTTPGTSVVATHDNAGNKITAEWTSANVITIKTYAAADTTVLADSVLSATEFKIQIFN